MRPDEQRRPYRLQEVQGALDGARLHEAEGLLEADVTPRSNPQRLLLEARLRQYQSDAPGVIGLLSNARFEAPADEARRVFALATAHSRLAEYDAADEYFERADNIAKTLNDTELQSEIAYRRGVRFVFAGELEQARVQVAAAARGSLARELDSLHLESAILYDEGKFRQVAELLVRLLDRIDPSDPRMSMTAAYATHTLAATARDVDVPFAITAIERHLRACIWPEDLNVQRFQSLKALGWSYALRGDYFSAFRYLKQSATFAPSRAWYAIAMLDRAYLARCLREERWSRQELGEADEVAEMVDWHATRNEERVGLLLLAEMFAPLDSGKAAKYMGEYRDLGEMNARNMHFARTSLLGALANYSAGVTQLALGNEKAGVNSLRQSLAVYDRAGFDWRAGRCALRLFEATMDDSYLRLAGEKLRNYPNSWLAEELRELSGAQFIPTLPPMQQKVFEQLCKGYSTAQIAKNLGRSEYTVKNHIKLIFKAFGVRSRAALLATVSSLPRKRLDVK